MKLRKGNIMRIEYQNLVSKISKYDLRDKTVLLRIDGNVPINNGSILDDFKLEQVKRTISFIVNHGACCILLTHLGNPLQPSNALSTKHLLVWFKQYFVTKFISHFSMLETIEKKQRTVLLFENIRFFEEEKKGGISFAKKLASFGDIFVTDAFGAIHRSDTSIALLPLEFKKEKRTIGFLIEKELAIYNNLLKITPSFLIVGGGKPETKLPLAIKSAQHFDKILLCPRLVPIGKQKAEIIVRNNIIFPIDYIVQTDDGLLQCEIEDIPENGSVIAIGPKTIKLYQQYIKKAKLIMWNGFMGFLDKPETLNSSKQLSDAIEESNAIKIIAGTDTSNFIRHYTNISPSIKYFSTGGGASLALIAGEKLPGLEPFL